MRVFRKYFFLLLSLLMIFLVVSCIFDTTDTTEYEPTELEKLGSEIPVMYIDIDSSSIISKDDWISGIGYEIYGYDNEYTSGTLDIKGRGNTNWYDYPKKSYSLKLSTKAGILDMPSHKRWALLPNYADKTLLRTDIAFHLGDIFDNLAWTPRYQHIALYFNNQYWGVYQLSEVIKIDANRVNIESISVDNTDGGYILEIDKRKGEDFNFTTSKGVVFCLSDPDSGFEAETPGGGLLDKIISDVQKVEDTLYSMNFKDTEEGYRKYLDIDSFVDWYLVQELTKNVDANFGYSVYMYYDPVKQKYCMGPLWDFDFSMGNLNYTESQYSEGWRTKNSLWISRLFEDPWFVSEVKNRWNEKKQEVDNIFIYIDNRVSFIRNSANKNFEKWDILNTYVSPNPSVVLETYQEYIDIWKSWLLNRSRWLNFAINAL
jgi:hypothetical protein